MRELSGIQTAPDAPEIVQKRVGTALRPGQVIAGRYEIKNRLGSGGMGDVFRAHDRVLDEDVALKVIRQMMLEDPRALERLRAEVKIARKITHPHVCRVFDVGEDDALTFLTMELIEGRTLRHALAAGPIEQAHALDLFRQIVDGVAAAHEKGIIHRDLKPENILLRADGQCVVADFGLARNLDTGSTAAERAGTPAYMSPEQRRGDPIDVRSDVFALGLIGRELLGGKSPFDDEAKAELPMDRALQEVVGRALAEEPEKRFSSAVELATALVHVRNKDGDTAASNREAVDSKGLTGRTLPARAKWALGIVAAVVVAVLVRGGLVWRGNAISPAKTAPTPSASATSSYALGVERVTMAVLPFKNLTNDAAWAELSRSAPEAVRAVLRTIPDVLIVSDAPANPEALRATGIAFVVRGNVQRLGNGLRLFAQIEPVHDPGFVMPSEPVEIDLQGTDVAPALDSLRARLLDEARIAVARHRRWQRAYVASTNDLAREKLLAYYRLIDPTPRSEHFEPGLRLLDDAIAIDPTYVPARVERAFVGAAGAFVGTNAERYTRALLELDEAQRARADDPDVLVMRCRLLQTFADTQLKDAAIARAFAACQAALIAAPSSAHVHIAMARLHDRRCEDERAMRAYERAVELDRSLSGRALLQLVYLARQNGQVLIADRASAALMAFRDEEKRLGVRALGRRAGAPEVLAAYLCRGGVLLDLGRFAEANEAFSRELTEIAETRGSPFREATAIRGLLRAAAADGQKVPDALSQRLETIETSYRARVTTNPNDVQTLAKSYRSIDARAASEWIDRLGPAQTCDDALQRARIYMSADKNDRARAALAHCSPTEEWERQCIAQLAPRAAGR